MYSPFWSIYKIPSTPFHAGLRLTFCTSLTWTKTTHKTFIKNVSIPMTNTSFHNVTYLMAGLS